jgi:hypothetical protein
MSAVTNRDLAPRRLTVDMLFKRYVAWRDECRAVALAYEQWADADRGERGLAYAGYLAR